jgi:hypothetical protein
MTHDEIYCTNIKEMLIKKLRERYAKICFASMFILDVIEIIRYSDRIMVDNRLDGGAYINVQFKVNGVILLKGEVVHGCKVSKVLNNKIIISHEYITGNMAADSSNKIIGLVGLNKTIPVIVDEVRYNVGTKCIVMMCRPYTPQPYPEIYYNITEVTNMDKVLDVVNMIKEEEILHDKLKDGKLYTGYKTIIYPYKTARKFEQSAIGAKFTELSSKLDTLKDAVKSGQCITVVDYSVDKFIYVADKHISHELPVTSVNTSLSTALSEILLNRLYYLQMLRGFVETYDTIEKNQEMVPYWKACTLLKE